jgi:hypothetical protein
MDLPLNILPVSKAKKSYKLPNNNYQLDYVLHNEALHRAVARIFECTSFEMLHIED